MTYIHSHRIKWVIFVYMIFELICKSPINDIQSQQPTINKIFIISPENSKKLPTIPIKCNNIFWVGCFIDQSRCPSEEIVCDCGFIIKSPPFLLVGLVGEEVGVLLVGSAAQRVVLPQVRGQVGVGLGDGRVRGLGEVAQRAGAATGRGVTILNAGHHQQLLGNGRRHDAGTTGSGDQTHRHGSALAGHLKKEKRKTKCQLILFSQSISS